MMPFLLLGTGSVITYHDQLDGELFSYLLTAKYLFTNIQIYPELMNGLPAAGAVPPAPLFVLLYVFFKPFTSFMISQWIIYLTAFLGMYLLLLRLMKQTVCIPQPFCKRKGFSAFLLRAEFISFAISVIFMLLPFYPVYGLCIPGQPLLIFAVLSLLDKEYCSLKNTLPYYLLIVFYGAASSLVLVGFACLLLLGIFACCQTISAIRSKKAIPFSPLLAFSILLATYLVTNFGLIKQVLFPESTYISHKTEMILSPQNFSGYWKEAFGTGISYAQSYHAILFVLIILCLLISFLQFASNRMHPASSLSGIETMQAPLPNQHLIPLHKALWILLFIFLLSLFYAFYHDSFVTEIRNSSNGILKTFNLSRICWLLPTAWCMLAGYLFSFIANLWESKADVTSSQTISPLQDSKAFSHFVKAGIKHCIILITLCAWGITVLLHSPLRPNLSKLLKGENYYALDWNAFFAEDIFSQINTAIGKPQESYRVISVGIYPAAAAYNGFYCLDGYSNNYPLEYKHTFRQIMEGELKKNDYIRDFFDNWGNRCYITTAEQANYYTFEKKWNSVIYDLDLNIEKLKELNCKYIFSAAYLMNAEEKGLSLLQEAPFETEKSWYHIYVYAINYTH